MAAESGNLPFAAGHAERLFTVFTVHHQQKGYVPAFLPADGC